MVLINIKVSERNQFLYETTTGIEIGQLIKELVLSKIKYIKNFKVNNLRVKVDRLALIIEELFKHGPLKPEGLRGLNLTEEMEPDIEDKFKVPKIKMPDRVGTRFNEDPSHQRTGWILEEDVTATILNGIIDAKDYLNPKRVEEKKTTSLKELLDLIEMLKAGVMIGYPAYYGLPEWEPCRVLLEEKDDILDKEEPNLEYYKFEMTSLWNAGKEYIRGKFLSDYVGKNEKTKVVCKFSRKGSGAPVREPLVDKDTQQKMLSYYYKKQEEQKKLEVNSDDSYLNSQWADSNGMKKSLYHGDKDIQWKFK